MEIIRLLKASALAIIALAIDISCAPHSPSSLLGSQRTDVFFPFVEQVIQPERIVSGEWTEITLIVSCESKPEVLFGRKADEMRLERGSLAATDFAGTLCIASRLNRSGPPRYEYNVAVLYVTPGEKTLSLRTVATKEEGGAPGSVIGSGDEIGGIHIYSDVDLVTRQFYLTVVPPDD